MSSRQNRKARVRALWLGRLAEVRQQLEADSFWAAAIPTDGGASLLVFYRCKGGMRGALVSLTAVRKRTAAQVCTAMRARAEAFLRS